MKTLTAALSDLAPGGDFTIASDRLPQNADVYDASVEWRGPGDKPTWSELLAYFAELERPTPEAQRAAAYALAARMHADFLNQITGDATTEERDTWPAKAEAARAHLAGVASAAQNDILDGETQDGARSKDELASVILANDKRYRPFAGRARAVLSAHNTAISDAPVLDIETTLETARADCAAAYAGLLTEFATEDTPEIDVSDTMEARVKALEGAGSAVTIGMIEDLTARLDALEAPPDHSVDVDIDGNVYAVAEADYAMIALAAIAAEKSMEEQTVKLKSGQTMPVRVADLELLASKIVEEA